MRKIFSVLIVSGFVAAVPAFAANPIQADKAASKFARGIANVATCWGEYITQLPVAIEKSPDYLTGFLYGAVRGTGFTVRRAVVGLYDAVTFPFPGMNNYAPLIRPETVFTPTMDALSD